MLDNNNYKNSSCAFAEQIVSYLYGEANAQEKTLFESHLNSCAACAEEFAGFSVIRSSIVEWRNEEFLSLETPLPEIPYEKARHNYNLESGSSISRSWLTAFRELFTMSPALTASASLALIVFCIGIVFFAAKSSNNIETVNNINDGKKIIVPPMSKENSQDENLIASKPIAGDNTRQTFPEPKVLQKGFIVKATTNTKNSVKFSNQSGKARIFRTTNSVNKISTFARNGKIPRLNNVEEVEDKSLRLAELLDDGDSD
jgi:hypothetical protein